MESVGLSLTRIYKNGAGDTIRIDSIYMSPTTSSFTTGINRKTFYRRLQTNKILVSSGSRTVASIEILTDCDTYEASSGNFTWVEWISPPCRCDMSDLPFVGETV